MRNRNAPWLSAVPVATTDELASRSVTESPDTSWVTYTWFTLACATKVGRAPTGVGVTTTLTAVTTHTAAKPPMSRRAKPPMTGVLNAPGDVTTGAPPRFSGPTTPVRRTERRR